MDNPYTLRQLVTFAILVLKNKTEFEDGIRTWNKKVTTNKTWSNFKTKFENDYSKLNQYKEIVCRSIRFTKPITWLVKFSKK